MLSKKTKLFFILLLSTDICWYNDSVLLKWVLISSDRTFRKQLDEVEHKRNIFGEILHKKQQSNKWRKDSIKRQLLVVKLIHEHIEKIEVKLNQLKEKLIEMNYVVISSGNVCHEGWN